MELYELEASLIYIVRTHLKKIIIINKEFFFFFKEFAILKTSLQLSRSQVSQCSSVLCVLLSGKTEMLLFWFLQKTDLSAVISPLR